MSARIPPAQLASLRQVFGGRVPADHADVRRMLETSPLAPRDPAALAALRELAVQSAGQDLPRLQDAHEQLTRHSQPRATAQRSMPGPMALRLAEMSSARQAGALSRVVTPERAQELFKQMASAPDIPHDFVDEGCHLRAHVEAKRMEDAGVYSEKAFCVPDGGDLRINTDKNPVGFTLGMFHVAPTVFVQETGGKVERWIIDPSLFKQAVPLATWQATMSGLNGKPTDVVFLPRHAFHISDRDNPPESWNARDMEDALAWNTQYQEVVTSLKEMNFYDHLVELAADAEKQRGTTG